MINKSVLLLLIGVCLSDPEISKDLFLETESVFERNNLHNGIKIFAGLEENKSQDLGSLEMNFGLKETLIAMKDQMKWGLDCEEKQKDINTCEIVDDGLFSGDYYGQIF